MAATYVGNLMGDKNMTMWGNLWAQEAIQEFERFDTLSEVYPFVSCFYDRTLPIFSLV